MGIIRIKNGDGGSVVPALLHESLPLFHISSVKGCSDKNNPLSMPANRKAEGFGFSILYSQRV
jgi:hypothetical protein